MKMRIFLSSFVIMAVFCTAYAVPVSDQQLDSEEDDEGALLSDQGSDPDIMQGDTDNNYYDDVDDSNNKGSPDGSTEKNGNEDESAAQILTPEKVFEKNIAETVDLPCQTPQNDDGVIIWYKDDVILFQGNVAMSARPNNKYMPDNSLRISSITADDDGQYRCDSVVSKNNKASITHTLRVRVPPSQIDLRAKDNQTILSVGQELVLTCHAKGYPEPIISWHKEIMKDGKTINERLRLTGNKLTIPNISRKDEGRYLCFADNNIERPAVSYVNIELTHPPIVNIEKIIVNSDKDMDTELKCTVKAKPTASVLWMRNGNNLKSTEHIQLISEGNDHLLILKGLQESDFGKYVCLAKNYLGTVEKSISLVKTPAVQEFIKPEKPTKDLVLTWRVESKTPITEHELQYRKKGESEWHSVKPTVHEGEDSVYIIKYTLTGLGDGTYETRCRSMNLHGWSDYSEITVVEGEKTHHGKHGNKKPHKHHNKEKTTLHQEVEMSQQPEKESEIGESKNAAPSRCSSSLTILSSIVFLYVYINRL